MAVLLSGGRLEWTLLRRRKTELEVAVQQSMPLNAADASPGKLREMMGPIKDHLTVILPTDSVLLRTADLPATDPEELAGMVELQVDKFSPFPIEQMAVSFEALKVTGNSTRVLIAACRRSVVEKIGELFTAAGRQPDRIEVAVSGWWGLLRAEKAIPSTGRHALLLLEEGGCDLMILQDGIPVLIRSLGCPGEDAEAFAVEVAEETGYTLTSLESEWGGHPVADLTVWHRGVSPDSLMDRLRVECALRIQAQSLDSLPMLTEGVARRDAAAGEAVLIDMALPEWKQTAAQQRGRQKAIKWVASLAAIWIGGMAALFLLTHLQTRRIDRLQADIQSLEGPAEQARALRSRVESLEQYADRTHSALECLREITLALPGGVELTSLTYRKGGQVNLRGESTTVPPIYDFFEAMEASSLFVEVRPEGVTQAPGGRRKPEFRLTARLPGEEP